MRRAWRALPALCCSSRRLRRTPTSASCAFCSDVQIQQDSSLDVTETIDVQAENDRINHGIYRDFPTHYRGPHGSSVRVGFTFEGATLDGSPVPASDRARSATAFGSRSATPTSYVDVGEHSYVLHYRTTRADRPLQGL